MTVERQRHYADRLIDSQAITPSGPAARAALAQLILDGQILAPAGKRLAEDIAAWNLYVHLEQRDGAAVDAETWLAARLEALGVEQGEDLALLEPDDLAFEGIPSGERPRFDRRYPRHLRLENLEVTVHYEPRRKQVTLERCGGKRRSPPMLKELPAWAGWSIRYQDGSRIVPLKDV